jgi:hypothetical protein
MAEKKVIELEVKENLGNLKQQLKAAQVEVQTLADKFGATSAQAVEAAKKAAILKDKIGDAKALTDAFNPDAKFKALSGALTGVAAGFSVVTGAMAVFGKQNEDVEKALLKVQGAMALASGAQAIGESIDAFKQLGAVLKANTVVQQVLTVATRIYNAVMAANPIGAIIVAITALIAAGYALVKMFQASADANEKAEGAIKKNNEALKEQTKTINKTNEALKTKNGHEYEMAKAAGASSKALRELSLKHAEEEVALQKASLATAKNTYEKEKNTLASYKNAGVSDELIAKQRELVDEARKASAEERKDLEAAEKNKAAIVRKNAVEVQQEITDKNTKLKEANKTHNDAIKQQNEEAAKTELERVKTLKENIASLEEESRVSKLTEEQKEVDALNKKYDKIIEDGKKQKLNVTKLEEDKRLALLAITKKYDDLEAETKKEKDLKSSQTRSDEAMRLKELTMSESEFKLEQLRIQYQKEIALATDNEKLKEALRKKLKEEQDKVEKEEEEKKAATLQRQLTLVKDSFQAFADVATLFAGKNKKAMKTAFVIQKASNIAQTTIDTYTAAMSAYKSALSVPVIGTALAPIAAAGATAVGLLNIRKIAASQFEGGGTPSADTGGGAPTMSAPQFNVVGQSGLNQLASLNQQPIQAYVVSGQVTSQQALDRNRLENATLGG